MSIVPRLKKFVLITQWLAFCVPGPGWDRTNLRQNCEVVAFIF